MHNAHVHLSSIDKIQWDCSGFYRQIITIIIRFTDKCQRWHQLRRYGTARFNAQKENNNNNHKVQMSNDNSDL